MRACGGQQNGTLPHVQCQIECTKRIDIQNEGNETGAADHFVPHALVVCVLCLSTLLKPAAGRVGDHGVSQVLVGHRLSPM